jgi:hypothetical protein
MDEKENVGKVAEIKRPSDRICRKVIWFKRPTEG